jgi:hypothetical protein
LAAVRAIEKSMAYVLYRLLICLGASLGYLLATLAGAGTLVGFASLTKNASALGPFGAVIGFALFAYLMAKLKPIWLNAVDVPQLALLADQARGVILPTGKAQIECGKQRAASCFPSTAGLFKLDQAIRKTQEEMADFHPCPRLSVAQPLVKKYLDLALQRLSALNHQTLLAWHFFTESNDPWDSAAGGLAIQEQQYHAMTRNRFVATVFSWLGFLAFYPLLLAGIDILVEGIPIDFSVWTYVFAGVFAWAIKAAFFDAIAEAAMMAYFFSLAGKSADSTSGEALASQSAAYREIRRQAGQTSE